MAERIARLYGPAHISKSLTSPTTLFTVPTGKLYVVRSVAFTTYATSDTLADGSVVLGIDNLKAESIFTGNSLTSSTQSPVLEIVDMAVPVSAGESVKGAYFPWSGAGTVGTDQYFSSDTTAWDGVNSTTDATSYASATFTPQANLGLSNFYFCVVNSKATTPDTVSGFSDAHTDPITNVASIATVATSTIRATILGGYAQQDPGGNAAYTFTFGGTQTGCFIEGVAPQLVAMAPGSPSTSNVLLQTATASGTTETDQTVTMTANTTIDTWQLMVVGTTGVASSYTAPTNGTEIADGNHATPNDTAAVYFIYPAVDNPTAVLASAGTSWAAVVIEGIALVAPAVTVSGVIIE